jgi:hypothetical protein
MVQVPFFPHFVSFFQYRQDALQRHWDKYCRKKSKRHLDKQTSSETQTRSTSTLPSMRPSPEAVYAPTAPPQTTSRTGMGIGTGIDQVNSFLKF